jgi:hypothetical protein
MEIDLDKIMKELPHALNTASAEMAKAGWAIPMLFTPREFVYVSQLISQLDIDNYMFDYYMSANKKPLRYISEEILESESLSMWRPLLEECVKVVGLGLYRVAIPGLMTVVEGAASKYCGKLQSQSLKIVDPIQEIAGKLNSTSMKGIMAVSVSLVIANLFAPSGFDGDKPCLINRHWILHGRDSPDWAGADAVRLMNLLDVLSKI